MFERPPLDSDRSFTAWLDADSHLRPPDDLLERVLSRTAATPRRPGWLVIERWFPMEKTAKFGAIPRTAIILVTLGLMALLVTAIAVGAQPKLPTPYGDARNGSITYSQDGDIYLMDPDGSDPRAVVTGPELDRWPSFSRDGTMMMFGRGSDSDLGLMIANADGTQPWKLTDAAVWADFLPDGEVYATHTVDGKPVLTIYDLDKGTSRDLPIGDHEMWGWVAVRPPDGKELVFMDHVHPGGPARGLFAIATDGMSPPRMIGEPGDDSPDGASASDATFSLQDGSISPDGRTVAYWSWEKGPGRPDSGPYLHQRDLDTGLELPVPYVTSDGFGLLPHFSPDGKWVAFEDKSRDGAPPQGVNLAPVDGSSPPVPVGPGYSYMYRTGFDFSPDGKELILALDLPGKSVIIDLATQETTEVPAVTGYWGWQRLAP